MAEGKPIRISKLQKEFNVGIGTIVAFLKKKGYEVEEENNPNAKIPAEWYPVLAKEFSSDVSAKKEAEKINLRGLKDLKETITVDEIKPEAPEEDETARDILIKDNTGKKPVDIPARPKTESRPAAARPEEPAKPAKVTAELPDCRWNKSFHRGKRHSAPTGFSRASFSISRWIWCGDF